MPQYHRKCLPFVSLLLCLAFTAGAAAQATYPFNKGDKVRYAAMIETPKAYLSGICIMYHNEDDELWGSLFNEFGISALDFTYSEKKDKVKLRHVIGVMNKWYIKKVLRRDLREMMRQLRQGHTSYSNDRHHLNYRFTPMEPDEHNRHE